MVTISMFKLFDIIIQNDAEAEKIFSSASHVWMWFFYLLNCIIYIYIYIKKASFKRNF